MSFHYEPVARTFAIFTTATFAVNAWEIVKGYSEEENLNIFVALFITAILVGMCHFFLEFAVTKFPKKFKIIRKIYSPIANIEGFWLQFVHTSNYPNSVVCFEFDSERLAYCYHGVNFYLNEDTFDLGKHAIFHSANCSIDAAGGGLTFHFDGVTNNFALQESGATTSQNSSAGSRPKPKDKDVDESPIGRVEGNFQHIKQSDSDVRPGESSPAKGYGKIVFTKDGTGSYGRGVGEFFERNPAPNWKSFELYKIPNEIVRLARAGREKEPLDDTDYQHILAFALKDYRIRQGGLKKRIADFDQGLRPAVDTQNRHALAGYLAGKKLRGASSGSLFRRLKGLLGAVETKGSGILPGVPEHQADPGKK